MPEYEPTSTGRTGAIQQWMVPATGKYRITVAGAAGGLGDKPFGRRGRGAVISGDFELEEGEILDLLVGQMPVEQALLAPGGGGTFVVRAPADTSYIMYVYREGLRTVDREIMEFLILTCHAPVRAVSVSEFLAWNEWANVAMLVMGFPPNTGSTYDSPGNPSLVNYSDMEFPVVSLCRHTSRNRLGMQAGNSSGSATPSEINLSDSAPDLGWNTPENIIFDSPHGNAQAIAADVIGDVIYETSGTNPAIVVHHYQNGHARIHCGIYKLMTVGSGFQDMFRDMIGIRPEQYQPLIVAGAGGGARVGDTPFDDSVADASLTEEGKAGLVEGSSGRRGIGGENGMGGHYDGVDRVQGGGGFYGFGITDNDNAEFAGFPFMAAGFGGLPTNDVEGGYGGGGSTSISTVWGGVSGGGGYSGGGGAYASSAATGASGGGGGSFNSGDNPQHVGWNEGEGWVLIQQIHTVGNRARNSNGEPVDEVIIREWMSKELVISSVPDEHGDWTADLLEGMYEVHYYHHSSQPLIHGPYTVGQ